ncbi:uncharacterized protein LOC107999717 isoform X3 [Apis cerana]|nr:uncharacterized protein LOC107999717 isoform X3 [Apis cerana]
MPRQSTYWEKFVFVYILHLFSYVTSSMQMHVRLIAPRYVTYNSTATMHCNHSVPDEFLHKVEFMKDDKRILQYIKDRKPPFHRGEVEGASMEHFENGTTIKLKNLRFEASGSYHCLVTMTTPIYTEHSESVPMKVIVPQTENPKITFKKNSYVVGESLEANCTSSAAHPVPHLTWYINGKEVDISLVNHYPHTHHKNQLMSATAKLVIEVSALHTGKNGNLEISCHSTIPDYAVQYADIKKESVMGLGTTATLESCLRRYLRSTKIRFVSRSLHGQLSQPFYINSYVKFVTLPAAYDANIFQTYPDPCTAVGWGRHIPGSNKGTGTYLRHVHLPLIPHEKCPVEGVHPKLHLCAGVLKG